MQDRFTLRFQDGEREGDIARIGSPRFTVGRRPGNSIQLQDSSVSGQHAEFVTDDEGLLLRDLGSTNGTRLGGEKITEARPQHGDVVTFGSVNAIFEDSESGEIELEIPGMPVTGRARPATSSVPKTGAPAQAASAGQGLESVSAELVARSRQGSKGALIGVVALLLIGGGAAAYFLTQGESKSQGREKPVAVIPGNKLSGSSFEGEAMPEGWSSTVEAPAVFSQRGDARASGQDGARASLAGGEWAELKSEAVSVTPGRQVDLSAQLRARGDASGRVGIEFLRAQGDDDEQGFLAWGPWIEDVSTHQEILLTAPVPAGLGRARVVVMARAAAGGEDVSGTVDVDDLALVPNSSTGTPTAKIGDYSLWGLGEGGSNLHVTKISSPWIGNLRGVSANGGREFPVKVNPGETGFGLDFGGAGELRLRVETEALDGGLATLGGGRFVERGNEWQAEGVESLLIGSGHGLVALTFERPVTMAGRAQGAANTVRIQHGGQTVQLLVNFQAQRDHAGDLAFAARNAEAAGQLGLCLEKWNEILAQSPYDADLVEEARSTRGRLTSAGREELKEVEVLFEQAKFFRLADLFRTCHERASAIGEKYRGSDVEGESQALVATIQESLGVLEKDLSRDEVQRLTSIVQVLDNTQSPGLANAVRSYMSEEFGKEN